MDHVLVLGIGNVLMGDEGAGVAVVRDLERRALPPGVTVIDGGTGGFHLLSYLTDHDPVIMVDATMDGQPPGTVSLLEPRYASDFPRSLTAHDIGLRDLVASAAMLGRLPKVYLLTVSIDRIQPMETALSPAVAAAVPLACDRALGLFAELASRGAC
jgi:hydrogenase maturation protease